MSALYEFDRAAQAWLQSPLFREDALLGAIAAAFNWWGGPGVIWCAALLWLGGRAVRWRAISLAGLRGAEGIAIASALSGITKGLAGRERPFLAPGEPWHWHFNHGWTDARYFSMPSGHTTAAVAFAVATLVVALRWPPAARTGWIAVSGASAVLTGFARVFADQHWLTDVLAALLLGAATSLALARVHARHPASRYDRALLGSPTEGR
jgi:membrane-associated phospholipid phosphatase